MFVIYRRHDMAIFGPLFTTGSNEINESETHARALAEAKNLARVFQQDFVVAELGCRSEVCWSTKRKEVEVF